MSWQLQEAKNKLSAVVKAAESKGPQVITIRGKETAVVLSIDDYKKLKVQREPLGTFLWRTTPKGIDPTVFDRVDDRGRDIGL